jgi:hypothetical protein
MVFGDLKFEKPCLMCGVVVQTEIMTLHGEFVCLPALWCMKTTRGYFMEDWDNESDVWALDDLVRTPEWLHMPLSTWNIRYGCACLGLPLGSKSAITALHGPLSSVRSKFEISWQDSYFGLLELKTSSPAYHGVPLRISTEAGYDSGQNKNTEYSEMSWSGSPLENSVQHLHVDPLLLFA